MSYLVIYKSIAGTHPRRATPLRSRLHQIIPSLQRNSGAMYAKDSGGPVAVPLRGGRLGQGVVHGLPQGRGTHHRGLVSHNSTGRQFIFHS